MELVHVFFLECILEQITNKSGDHLVSQHRCINGTYFMKNSASLDLHQIMSIASPVQAKWLNLKYRWKWRHSSICFGILLGPYCASRIRCCPVDISSLRISQYRVSVPRIVTVRGVLAGGSRPSPTERRGMARGSI